MTADRRTLGAIVAVAAAGLAIRIGYVVALPGSDPTFLHPILDGAYYLAWARDLASGAGGPDGAFYLAPLYPYVLALRLKLLGDGPVAIALVQQVVAVVTAGILGLVADRVAGRIAGVTATILVLGYHPAMLFASHPIGETAGIALMAIALWAYTVAEQDGSHPDPRWVGLAGIALGAACLARPNLLAVLAMWATWQVLRRRPRVAAVLILCAGVVILPVTFRNVAVSGHVVPISANAGITLYHGNGPGATGTYTPAVGLSGSPATQRGDAIAAAATRTGRVLDAVEADRWWGREAVRVRIQDPSGTLRLVLRRLMLTLSTAEIGQDLAPELDINPWRYGAPVPYWMLLGLAAAGAVLGPWRQEGAGKLWGAVLGCAVAPVIFYVSSRYRLPLAILLAVPAAVGVAGLVRTATDGRRRAVALAVALVAALVSILTPVGADRAASRAGALSNRGSAWLRAGLVEAAEADLRQAIDLDPRSGAAHYNLGVVLEKRGDTTGAEATYRRVLASDPGHAEAAGNLGGILIRSGRPQEAVAVLERALLVRPAHGVCWGNLVVALVESGDVEAAVTATRRAAAAGVDLDPRLVEAVRGLAGESREGNRR